MSNIYGKAGLRIRKLRELRNMTREAFSELVEISPKFLYEIETGQKGFSADTLYRIANALSVSTEYILTGDDHKELSVQLKNVLDLFNDTQLEVIYKLLKNVQELSLKNEH
ncbi:MAG: helix-turn-helix domain-containing protein [Clostridia bacterium]|nr:helix-turn-helix domain-containing protein [Clostridia bacterium]